MKVLLGICAVLLTALVATSCGEDNEPIVAEVTTTAADAPTTHPEDSSSTTSVADPTTTTAAAPAPSDGAGSPEEALRKWLEAKGLGQDGRAWDVVLPSQRALLDRDSFSSCSDDGPSVDVVTVEVVDQYSERDAVPGLGEQDSQALTLKITLNVGGEEFTDTDTYHAYNEGGRWYVSLTEENFDCAKP